MIIYAVHNHKETNMKNSIKLHIWGDYACFTRPEMKVERVSYDVITPSAARGILEAIHWKPAIFYQIKQIHVLRPIKFVSIRRNELGSKISEKNIKTAIKRETVEGLCQIIEEDRTQRSSTILKDVAYIIEAEIRLTEKAGESDNIIKHTEMFKRRAQKGQYFHQPYMGVREFIANFAYIEDLVTLPECTLSESEKNKDLGWILYDIDFKDQYKPLFFQAQLEDGVLYVPDRETTRVKK